GILGVGHRRRSARPGLHEDLMTCGDEIMHARRCERDAVLVVLDLGGNADPHRDFLSPLLVKGTVRPGSGHQIPSPGRIIPTSFPPPRTARGSAAASEATSASARAPARASSVAATTVA